MARGGTVITRIFGRPTCVFFHPETIFFQPESRPGIGLKSGPLNPKVLNRRVAAGDRSGKKGWNLVDNGFCFHYEKTVRW